MRPEETAALGVIAAVYSRPVLYTGAGLVNQTVDAIRSDSEAEPFQGAGSTLRETSFEIKQALLPDQPRKGNIIVDAGQRWSVNDITRRDDVGAWVLVVEEAAAA